MFSLFSRLLPSARIYARVNETLTVIKISSKSVDIICYIARPDFKVTHVVWAIYERLYKYMDLLHGIGSG